MTRQYAAQARGNAESDAAVRRIAEVARTAELEQLAAGLAHHINQPLGAIAAYAQAGSRVVAGSSPHADQAAAIFREITRLALEAGADVGQIRSRYTAQSAAPSRCRIEGVIAQLEPMLQRIAAAHGGSLELDVESGLPEVRIDAARIQYVLASLVRHGFAGAHRSADAPRVRIELRAEAGGIVISVIAAGACPPAGERDTLQPFLANELPAANLSLAASRSIVEAHRGVIGFEPLRDAGRTWFRLPVAEL